MKCGCHDLAGEAASARSHRDRDEALHPPRASAMQSPLLRPRHGASGVWTPSCISSTHSRSSSAHALSPLEILSSGVGCLALLHRHEHGIPTHPHGLAVRPVRRRARPGHVSNCEGESHVLQGLNHCNTCVMSCITSDDFQYM